MGLRRLLYTVSQILALATKLLNRKILLMEKPEVGLYNRSLYEFSSGTKKKAVRKSGLQNGQVHHRLPIWVAVRHGIIPELIKSEDNALVLEPNDHELIHRYEEFDYYDELAQEMLIEQRSREHIEIEDETTWC